jgi:hypothetical protein
MYICTYVIKNLLTILFSAQFNIRNVFGTKTPMRWFGIQAKSTTATVSFSLIQMLSIRRIRQIGHSNGHFN